MAKQAIVLTTINAPNFAMEEIAKYAERMSATFIVIGDTKTPKHFHMNGAAYYGYERQQELPYKFPRLCPAKHYARKNVGFLLAAEQGAEIIIETDDDNIPKDGFDAVRNPSVRGDGVADAGWTNVYRLFCDQQIWPRGLPLTEILKPAPNVKPDAHGLCPIQQGLADDNPDVDAIYRLAFPLPISFQQRSPVILGKGVWSPFNSQNTTFFRDAFLLTYLPYHCSFRMTDIWRGLVAQRILWECEWSLMFHSATVYQVRNEHNLMKDFEDEVPGYLQNDRIKHALEGLSLKPGKQNVADNLIECYRCLISMGVVGAGEELLLEAWIEDMRMALGEA